MGFELEVEPRLNREDAKNAKGVEHGAWGGKLLS